MSLFCFTYSSELIESLIHVTQKIKIGVRDKVNVLKRYVSAPTTPRNIGP